MGHRLIVNADDFGFAPGVSRGIVHAHLDGIVTSTSVMITMPYATEAIKIAQREAPELGLGLHLNLTAGNPALPSKQIPDLVSGDGHFRNKADFISSLPTLDIAQIECELCSQIERFFTLAGHPPDHLDSHHHVTYLSPQIFTLMLRLAGELDTPIRYPFLTNLENVIPWMLQWGVRDNDTAIEALISELTNELTHSGIRSPDYSIGNFYGAQATLGDLLLILTDLPEGIGEVMCHPGFVDGVLRKTSRYLEKRETELQALTHYSTREVIETEVIEIITFADLAS